MPIKESSSGLREERGHEVEQLREAERRRTAITDRGVAGPCSNADALLPNGHNFSLLCTIKHRVRPNTVVDGI
jgi:hypothetical protein